MRIAWKPENKPARRPKSVVLGWLLGSAFVGLLIGLVEGGMLWNIPRAIPLLQPDVSYVVWFLAPLIDMAFFGAVGAVLGLLDSHLHTGKEVLAALDTALAITFTFLMVVWFHGGFAIVPLDFETDVVFPLIVLAVTFIIFLLILAAVWPKLAAFAERWLDHALKPLGWGIVAAAGVAAGGICVFFLWTPLSGPAAPSTVPPPSDAPNIVLITLDTVRADHLSSYGYSRPTTPNLDAFARTGVLFENAIAPSSWTLPSHASMFTGLLPQQHGAESYIPMASGPQTLAQVLRSQGYQTAAFIGNPLYLERGWNIARGFEVYDDGTRNLGQNLAQTFLGTVVVQPLYQILWLSGLSQSNCWFDRRSAADLNSAVYAWERRRQPRPYFLFINYIDAHDPYIAPEPDERRFGRLPVAVAQKLDVELRSGYRSGFRVGERSLLKDGYDNCLAYLDSQIGRLLSMLRRLPGWQNTIVIITSDHGEEFGGHGDYIHGLDLYRALLHVPLMIAGPEIPEDVRISHLVGTRQLFSTILDFAGHGQTPFSRTSLARFWNPAFKPAPSDDAVVSEVLPVYGAEAWRGMASLTTPQWQYIEDQEGRQQLYNWSTDPEEKNDLAEDAQDHATLTELRSRLVSLMKQAIGPWNGPEYVQALDGVLGLSRLSLLFPQPLQPGAPGNLFRIGFAQTYFKPQGSAPIRPTKSERELMQSLPYQ